MLSTGPAFLLPLLFCVNQAPGVGLSCFLLNFGIGSYELAIALLVWRHLDDASAGWCDRRKGQG